MSKKKFDHHEVEGRWRQKWVDDNVCAAENLSEKPKKFILAEFPYPSGTGLHMGHFMRYTLPEIYSRKLRMAGYNVMFPLGWDAFGLPAENYAVKTGVHPAETTEKAVTNFRRSLEHAGFGVDWDRIINTTDPDYYRWTQWIFLKFWEAGLAEIKEQPVWWCEELKTVLANEEVLEDEQGNKISERGEHPVEKRDLRQWILKITEYADKLLDGLNEIDFPEYVRAAQSNWIGKSFGAQISFPVEGVSGSQSLDVFTTRPDTIFGVTFMVVAPEHPLVQHFADSITNFEEVDAYRQKAQNMSDRDRQAAKEKTGVQLEGIFAKHPLDSQVKDIPIYIADYVLMDYGTGAIMAVPGHDERDFQFAQKYNIPVIQTVWKSSVQDTEQDDSELPFSVDTGFVRISDNMSEVFPDNSVSEVTCAEMKAAVTSALEKKGQGSKETTYRLRDWLFSRQRYWGEPIPLVHKKDGSIEAIVRTDDPDVTSKLPLELPPVPDFTPSSDGASPLAKNQDWVQTVDSEGNPALRETNTMPNWAGSCWYYLRYIDPKNDSCIADPELMKYWLPVDRYFGGSEHTTLHLLYSRFWHRFLYDQGEVPTPEPYAWRMNGGILLGEDGVKQSKSRGNVVDLNEMLDQFGADALRMYICFLGPYDATMAWNPGGLKACRKLVETIYSLEERVSSDSEDEDLTKAYHRMLKRVTSMIDNLKMNTAVSEFMIFVNVAKKKSTINVETWRGFLKTLAPFAVFLAEDLWQSSNNFSEWNRSQSVHLQNWPEFDPELAKDETIVLGVQVNGKVRDELEISGEPSEDEVKAQALALGGVKKNLEGKDLKKFIYIPGKIISIVAK